MKKMGKILAISMMSILLFSGILVGYGSAYEGNTLSLWRNQFDTQKEDPKYEPLPAWEGNTPGFWKNHLDEWVGFTPDQLVEEVYDIPNGIIWYLLIGSKTLLQALQFRGGFGVLGKARILLRSAVAGMLNWAHPDVNYRYRDFDLRWLVNYPLKKYNTALMIHNEALIDYQNNLGSDL